ncbi:MAG TPA: hypothetical protein VF040_15730 [Ktedonobacterales bacterium]
MSATTRPQQARAASGTMSGGQLLDAIRRALTPGRGALLLLALAVIYRLVLLARGWPALDSDEAVIGLMARHILQGDRPTFFWGQNYMGPFEAYFAAPLFVLFGSSTFLLGLSALLLTIGFLATIYALGRAAYGPAVGLLALGWLVISPPYFALRQLAPIGGYQELLFFSGLILLGVWSRLRLPNARPSSRVGWFCCIVIYAVVGYLAGLGFWSDMLIAPVLLVAAGALVFGRWRELLSLAGVALVLAFVIGAWPYISFNLATNNATFKQLSHQNNPPGWPVQTAGALTAGLPIVAGSPHVCITQGNIWESYPPAMARFTADNDPICQAPNVLISLGALALLAVVAWQLGRWLWRWLRQTPSLAIVREWLARRGIRIPPATEVEAKRLAEESDAEAGARRWLRAMLLGVALMTLVLFCTSYDAARFQFTSARYLLPLYLATPLFVGVLWEAARPVFLHASSMFRRKSAQADVVAAGPSGAVSAARVSWRDTIVLTLASAGLLWLLASSLYGGAQTLGYAADATRFGSPILPMDRQIIAFLDAHQLTAYYTNDYWACYRIAFEANERLHCTMRGDVGEANLRLLSSRYQPWVDELAHMPHPTYLLTLNSVQDQRFSQIAAAEGLPHAGYRRAVIGAYAIYYYPG